MTVNLSGFQIEIDEEDFERISKRAWSVRLEKDGRLTFRCKALQYGRIIKMTLQRFLLAPPDGTIVGRRPQTRCNDFRKAAFKVCRMTERQSMISKNRSRKSSRFKGVSKTRGGRWRASIRPGGRSLYLGEYASEEEAARAYDVAARKYFGDEAFQNFYFGEQAR